MGTIKTSLSHGPVYFNIYPNLSIALIDPNLSKVLELIILTNGYQYLPGSPSLSAIFKIHLKVLNTLNPYIRKHSELGQTVLIDTNLFSSQVAVPKMIPWNNITFPERWQIKNVVPVRPIISQTLDDVIQTQGGNVYLKFQRPLSRSLSSMSHHSSNLPYRVDLPESSRHSMSEPIEFVNQGMSSWPPSQSSLETLIQGIHISENQIFHGVYATRRPKSPTASDMNFEI